MADCKSQGPGHGGNKTQNNTKKDPSSVFNRSMTVNSSSSAPAAAVNKPLYNLSNSPAYQRNGSIKSSYSSSYGSTVSTGNLSKVNVRQLCSIFEPPKQSSSSPTPSPTSAKSDNLLLPGTEDRVVIYFTSLRGIRRTFHDCHSIRMIFRGFRVNIDERDVSMDVAYKKEVQKLFGENNVSLPQVFIKGKYIGGADLIIQLLEGGELAKLVKGVPLRALKPCDACDDVRFLPCTNCNGSRKVFDEDEQQPKRCCMCNENGLVRCLLCCL